MRSVLQIAIDGPVASGKGDIAARLAKELKLVYLYTGAMYRSLALACMNRNISTRDKMGVLSVLRSCSIDLVPSSGIDSSACRVLLDGKDVTERITKPDVAAGSSDVAIIPQVRSALVTLQQKMAEGKSVVMEGRDIGLRVLPRAQLKIFLTASLEERARRRFIQWQAKGITKTLKDVIEDTKKRDIQDMHREVDPLQKLPDAWELDTTGLTQDQIIKKIKQELVRRRLL